MTTVRRSSANAGLNHLGPCLLAISIFPRLRVDFQPFNCLSKRCATSRHRETAGPHGVNVAGCSLEHRGNFFSGQQFGLHSL